VCGFVTVPVPASRPPARALTGKERLAQERWDRVSTFLSPRLEADDALRIVTPAHTRPRGTIGLEFLIGGGMFLLMHWYIVVLTQSRFVVIDCGRSRSRPQSVAWNEPIEVIRVLRYQEGRLWTKLYVDRHSDSAQIRLLIGRIMRAESRQIAEALDVNTTK
jgi:hypothetical protein